MTHSINSDGEEPSDLTADRISDLPWNALDIILGKLPLADAVRTSALAKDWRYKWLSLSKFVFDTHEFSESLNYDGDGLVPANSLINNFLLNHSSAVKKFVLKAYCASHYCDVYQWMHYLSKMDVEFFIVVEYGDQPFFIPSHLFLFTKLKHLFLGSCALRIPPCFQKFKFLSELYLSDTSISDEDLERLIIACPKLERLSLIGIIGLKHLKIHAPKLKFLLIDYGYRDIHFESADDLVLVTILITYSAIEEEVNPDWRSILWALSGLPSLLNLGLSGGLIRIMAVDYRADKCPFKNNSLVSLYIHSITFDCIEVFQIFLSFVRSCPNLESLRFTVTSAEGAELVSEFLKENEGRLLFPKLKLIQMMHDTDMGPCLELLEFMGSHSPNLTKVNILKEGRTDLSNARVDYVLSRLRRCCPQATVLYEPYGPNF